MNKFFLLLFISTVFFGCKNDSSSSPRQIQVTGFANRSLKPDQLNITVTVNLQDKNMKAAKERMDFAQGKVWEALKQLNIEKSTINESGIQFQRQEDYRNNTKEFYYYASNSIQFKIKDFSIYDSVVNAMTSIPDVNVNPPQPVISNERQIRDEVRSEAVLDAKKKAESMVKPLRLKLGKPILMNEGNSSFPPGVMFESGARTVMMAGSSPHRPQEFAAGDQEISVQVSVHFEIE